MPGAKKLLDQIRKPDTRLVLISNRWHAGLEKEVNHLGMMHYFDKISGTPQLTIEKADKKSSDEKLLPMGPQRARPVQQMPESAQKDLMAALRNGKGDALRQVLDNAATFAHPDITSVRRIHTKPDSKRLLDSLTELSIAPNVPIVSIGDQPKDVTQLKGIRHAFPHVRGVVVNPGLKEQVNEARETHGVPMEHHDSLVAWDPRLSSDAIPPK